MALLLRVHRGLLAPLFPLGKEPDLRGRAGDALAEHAARSLTPHWLKLVAEGRIRIHFEAMTADSLLIEVRDTVSVGREGDLRVVHGLSRVSRKHCTVSKRHDGWYLFDDGSKYGTRVARVSAESGKTLVARITPDGKDRDGERAVQNVRLQEQDVIHLAGLSSELGILVVRA